MKTHADRNLGAGFRARIQINAAIQSEGLMGLTINGNGPGGTHSEDRGQPPGYDFVIFRKSRPEVWGSRTSGATDQTFRPERNRHHKMNRSCV